MSDATDVTTRRGWAAVFCSVGRGTEVRSGTTTDEYNGIGWGKSKGESGRDTNGARDRRNRPWTVLVVNYVARSRAATVSYEHALDEHGVPYADHELTLATLRPL